MSYRYYLTQRPPMPGAFPKPVDNPVEALIGLDKRKFVKEINREAWGYVEYKKPLPEKEARSYELTEAGPAYMNLETGELLSRKEMLEQFSAMYDGGDDTNTCEWTEYYKEVQI